MSRQLRQDLPTPQIDALLASVAEESLLLTSKYTNLPQIKDVRYPDIHFEGYLKHNLTPKISVQYRVTGTVPLDHDIFHRGYTVSTIVPSEVREYLTFTVTDNFYLTKKGTLMTRFGAEHEL